MAITYKQGGQNIVDINTNPQVLQWHNELADQFMERDPLYKLTSEIGLGRQVTKNVKFEWGEFNKELVSFTVSDTVSATSHIVADVAGASKYLEIVADDVLYDATNDVYLIVTTTPTANEIVCKIVGATSHALITSDDAYNAGVFTRICNLKENGLLETEANLNTLSYYAKVTNEYNYCQNIELWNKIDMQLAKQPWNFTNISRLEHNRAVMLQDMIDDIERMMWFGKRSVIATAPGSYGSRGFVNFGIQTQTGSLSTFNYSNWLTFIRTKVMLENQQRHMTGFCNDYMLQFVQELVEDSAFLTLDAKGSQDSFGLEVFTLKSPTCNIDLRWCRALDEVYGTTSAVLCVTNMNKIGIRHLEDLDVTTKTMVQPTRAKFYLDNTYASLGTMLLNAGEHSMLTLT